MVSVNPNALCLSARVMVTGNINVADRLINGSYGTIVYLSLGKNKKFDDPFPANSMKTYGGKSKELAPITVVTKVFPYSYNSRTVIVERKQYPMVLAHAQVTGEHS